MEQITQEQIEATMNEIATYIINEPEFNIITLYDLVQNCGNETLYINEREIKKAIQFKESYPACNLNTLLAIIEMANYIKER